MRHYNLNFTWRNCPLWWRSIWDIYDPFRRPSALLATVLPVGSLKDKINTFVLKQKLIRKSIKGIFCKNKKSSLEQLKVTVQLENDWSFFKLFSGIFLENKLETPNRMFDFVMKMFSEGDAVRDGRNPKTTSYSIACWYFCTIQKSSTFAKIRFYQLGCWNKIGYYYSYWGELVSKLK
jgi:hypothetical protein